MFEHDGYVRLAAFSDAKQLQFSPFFTDIPYQILTYIDDCYVRSFHKDVLRDLGFSFRPTFQKIEIHHDTLAAITNRARSAIAAHGSEVLINQEAREWTDHAIKWFDKCVAYCKSKGKPLYFFVTPS
jgi:hypothetical protein